MQPHEAQSTLQDALKNVNWLNLMRCMDSLAQGNAWRKYSNTTWRPSFKQLELDLPWLLDNLELVCEALQVLRDQPRGGKDAE
jgi:hypothetical protein